MKRAIRIASIFLLLYLMAAFSAKASDSLILPGDVIILRDESFMNNRSISQLVLPDGLISIGDRAFYGCANLSCAVIPDSVSIIGKDAFTGCSEDFIISCSPNSYAARWAENNGIATDCGAADTTGVIAEGNVSSTIRWTLYSDGLLAIEGTGITPNYDYPSSVDQPWEAYNDSVTRVTISEGITQLGYYLLAHLPNMKTVSLPSTLTGINGGVFAGARSLQSCIVPEGVTSLGWDVFYDCEKMTYLQLPSTLSSISTYVFYNCASLKQLILPDKVTTLSSNAFKSCTGLRELYLGPNVRSVQSTAFTGCSEELTIYGIAGSNAQSIASRFGFSFSSDPFPSAAPETVQISGRVLLADGTGISGVTAMVCNASGVCVASGETDENGRWACQVTAPASYTVRYLHGDYSFSPAETSASIAVPTDLGTVCASLSAGEGTAEVSFSMTLSGEPIPQTGVMTGDPVTFSVTAPGATRVRLIADGQAYDEYWLTDGAAVFERTFTQSGERSISFQAYDGAAWGPVAPAQTLLVTALGVLETPDIHDIPTQYVSHPVQVKWDALEGADTYSLYLYTDRLIWPTLANPSIAVTDQLSMTIPGEVITEAGSYLIEVIAAGRGYSQSAGVTSFTVAETDAGVSITFPENNSTAVLGSSMTTQIVKDSRIHTVRLKVVPPTLDSEYLAPDENGLFSPLAKEPGAYLLIPYYFYEGDNPDVPIENQKGTAIRISVLPPQITSLVQGPNKAYAIGHTNYEFSFSGTLRSASEVKIDVNGSALAPAVPNDSDFFTTGSVALSTAGKYLFTFTPCWGNVTGNPVVFPVYEYEPQAESVCYAAEPLSLYLLPDEPQSSLIAFGSEITVLGTYEDAFLYVSYCGQTGFIASDSALSASPLSGVSLVTASCGTNEPYSPLGSTRSYFVSAEGAASVSAAITKPDGSLLIVPNCGVPADGGFTVNVACEQTGGYHVSFSAAGGDGSIAHSDAFSFVVVDTSSEYAGKECWSAKNRHIEVEHKFLSLSTVAKIDASTMQMYCIGTISDQYLYVHLPDDAGDEYAVVYYNDIQYTKNTTVYRAIIIVNPYDKEKYSGDKCTHNYTNIISLVRKIPNLSVYEALGKEAAYIVDLLSTAVELCDYNDITYIYWSGHGTTADGVVGNPGYGWGVLPKMYNDTTKTKDYSTYSYEKFCEKLAKWPGKINLILDSCYSGDFITTLEHAFTLSAPSFENPEKVAVLMSTHSGSPGIASNKEGSKFTHELTEYVMEHSRNDLHLSVIAANVDVARETIEVETMINGQMESIDYPVDPNTTYYGDPDRIFFAEDPDAVK